jgi:type IV pilus assembly protein PilA
MNNIIFSFPPKDIQGEPMRRSGESFQTRKLFSFFIAAIVAVVAGVAPVSAQQSKTPAKTSQSAKKGTAPSAAKKPAQKKPDDMAWLQDALKDPEFMKAVSHLSERLSSEVQMPAPRTQSRILARLPNETVFYGALPNYGPALRQALQIWQQELHDSAAIRSFLQKNKLDAGEPKFEEAAQKMVEFFDYLGDEIVITAGIRGKEPSGVLLAEVRKPGLNAYLEHVDQLIHADSPASKEHLRVVDPQQLQTATDKPGGEPIMLVRPDFVVIGLSAATLRDFNAQLDKGPGGFSASMLGKRLEQSYQSGTNSLFAADLQKLMGLIPQDSAKSAQITALLDKTGFGDARYALMESKTAGKKTDTQMELVFNGPRHGVASWVASSGPLGSLDFMSTKSAIVEAFRLKPPAQMFDDIVEMVGPMALQALPQIEQQFNVNLKQDILSKLGGEIGFEMDSVPTAPAAGGKPVSPNFRVLLSVTDPSGLQQTIKRLLAQSPIQPQERVEDGVTFYSVASPSASGAGQEFNYFFLDNYLVLASSRELAKETVSLHRGGMSVARAQAQPVKASMFARQNTNLYLTSMMSQLPPDIAGQLPKLLSQGEPMVNTMYGYADSTSIRGTTDSNGHTDIAVGLIVAAVAIPNLLHSKMAANQAAAASTVRTINTAQVTYATTYPQKGYARSLAVMGPGANGDCSGNSPSAAHACLLDETLGAPSCTSGQWCIKSGYKFTVRGICGQTGICSGYVATATPVTVDSTGAKSFCSTTDAVIRQHDGGVDAPLTVAQCKAWKAIQ